MPVTIRRWDQPNPPDAQALLARLRETGRDYSTWGNAPGYRYGVHTHSYRKHFVCLAGAIRFTLPATAEVVDLDPGDELDLPANTPHGAVVGPAGVRRVEAHIHE